MFCEMKDDSVKCVAAEVEANAVTAKERLWNREYLKVMMCNFLLFFAFYLLTPLLLSTLTANSRPTRI